MNLKIKDMIKSVMKLTIIEIIFGLRRLRIYNGKLKEKLIVKKHKNGLKVGPWIYVIIVWINILDMAKDLILQSIINVDILTSNNKLLILKF